MVILFLYCSINVLGDKQGKVMVNGDLYVQLIRGQLLWLDFVNLTQTRNIWRDGVTRHAIKCGLS